MLTNRGAGIVTTVPYSNLQWYLQEIKNYKEKKIKMYFLMMMNELRKEAYLQNITTPEKE